jgi:hypothetical protein
MAKKLKSWSKSDYANEAAEFVACYGKGYCWDEFVYEYCSTWDEVGHDTLRAPDQDLLMSAILKAEREA